MQPHHAGPQLVRATNAISSLFEMLTDLRQGVLEGALAVTLALAGPVPGGAEHALRVTQPTDALPISCVHDSLSANSPTAVLPAARSRMHATHGTDCTA